MLKPTSQKVLFLVSAFNGLSQAVYAQLGPSFGQVALQVGIDVAAIQAYQPDLILCPFLQDYLPPEIYEQYPALILHPGPANLGGPSSLARAILRGESAFGISLIQAAAGWDKGPLWAERELILEPGSLAKNYRNLVLPQASGLFLCGMERMLAGEQPLARAAYSYEPRLKDAELAFAWEDPASEIIKKIWAGDNQPGASANFQGQDCRFFAAWEAMGEGEPGQVLDSNQGNLQIACAEGSLWVGRIQVTAGCKNRAANLAEAS